MWIDTIRRHRFPEAMRFPVISRSDAEKGFEAEKELRHLRESAASCNFAERQGRFRQKLTDGVKLPLLPKQTRRNTVFASERAIEGRSGHSDLFGDLVHCARTGKIIEQIHCFLQRERHFLMVREQIASEQNIFNQISCKGVPSVPVAPCQTIDFHQVAMNPPDFKRRSIQFGQRINTRMQSRPFNWKTGGKMTPVPLPSLCAIPAACLRRGEKIERSRAQNHLNFIALGDPAPIDQLQQIPVVVAEILPMAMAHAGMSRYDLQFQERRIRQDDRGGGVCATCS